MRPTLQLLASHVHKPLIRFLGKRQPPSGPQTPHPHPAAPADIASHFEEFQTRRKSSLLSFSSSSSSSSSGGATTGKGSTSYPEFWEAPSRYWQPSREIGEKEMEAILSGGASLH